MAPKAEQISEDVIEEESAMKDGDSSSPSIDQNAKPKTKKMNLAMKKRLSNLARKKADERYYLNGKGRYVSKKKSENGKKTVQSRAIRLARKCLELKGMVLLGKGDDGIKLRDACAEFRALLKEGKSDEDAENHFRSKSSNK